MKEIALRIESLEIEKATGMNLYLPKGWQRGKITIARK